MLPSLNVGHLPEMQCRAGAVRPGRRLEGHRAGHRADPIRLVKCALAGVAKDDTATGGNDRKQGTAFFDFFKEWAHSSNRMAKKLRFVVAPRRL